MGLGLELGLTAAEIEALRGFIDPRKLKVRALRSQPTMALRPTTTSPSPTPASLAH
jgi:hypothetical protein